jgi:hypothetical protein
MPASSPRRDPARSGGTSCGELLELSCATAHSVPCSAVLAADDLSRLFAIVADHGARAHGFTSAWYTPQRRAAMAQGVTLREDSLERSRPGPAGGPTLKSPERHGIQSQ